MNFKFGRNIFAGSLQAKGHKNFGDKGAWA